MDSHLDELNYKTTLDVLSSHQDWSKNLAQLTHAVYSIKGKSIPDTIKKHKPTSPGQRGKVSVIHTHLYKGRPLAKYIP